MANLWTYFGNFVCSWTIFHLVTLLGTYSSTDEFNWFQKRISSNFADNNTNFSPTYWKCNLEHSIQFNNTLKTLQKTFQNIYNNLLSGETIRIPRQPFEVQSSYLSRSIQFNNTQKHSYRCFKLTETINRLEKKQKKRSKVPYG